MVYNVGFFPDSKHLLTVIFTFYASSVLTVVAVVKKYLK